MTLRLNRFSNDDLRNAIVVRRDPEFWANCARLGPAFVEKEKKYYAAVRREYLRRKHPGAMAKIEETRRRHLKYVSRVHAYAKRKRAW